MTKNQDKTSIDKMSSVKSIVANGETVNYLQNTGKAMLNDLKDFSSYSNQFFTSFNEKLAFECKSILQYSCKSIYLCYLQLSIKAKLIQWLLIVMIE